MIKIDMNYKKIIYIKIYNLYYFFINSKNSKIINIFKIKNGNM